jgi:hypothetical protein
LGRSPIVGICYSEHMIGDGATIFAQAYKLGFADIVSKVGLPLSTGPDQELAQDQESGAPGVLRFKDDEP